MRGPVPLWSLVLMVAKYGQGILGYKKTPSAILGFIEAKYPPELEKSHWGKKNPVLPQGKFKVTNSWRNPPKNPKKPL